MKSFTKRLLSVSLVIVLAMVTLSGCGKKNDGQSVNAGNEVTNAPESLDENAPKEIITLRFGTHHVPGLDPHHKDDVTGEYVMAEAEREARLAGEAAILEELGVKFEYIQFAGNTTEVLLQSVMANDPISDIAWLWGGSEGVVLAQNVLQKLDNYTDLFEDEDHSWMLYDKVFGHNYFLGAETRHTQRWPLVFNIDYIEAVDSLKDENGNTIYPTTLFEQGNWTWSTFRDYLQKIESFYADSSAPSRPERRIDAYQTDYRFAALSSVYSAGGSIYGPNGLQINSDETKKGVAFIDDLMNKKLLVTETYDDSVVPGWTWNGDNFQKGESVFTDIPDWYIEGAATQAAERGESIGIVPWPREDGLSVDDEKYNQVMTVSDSIGILKGISEEKTELALQALRLFYSTYYTELAGVETMAEFKDSYGVSRAAALGFDIFREEVGDSILDSFKYISSKVIGNDYSDLIGIREQWDDIVGKSLYGVGGTPAYDVAIEAEMQIFDNVIAEMTGILSQEGFNDNIGPDISTTGGLLTIAAGTTLDNSIWSDYIVAVDNVDGTLDISTMDVEYEYEIDFNVVGLHENAIKVKFTDQAGNTSSKDISLILFDPNNTTAPTITVIEEPDIIEIDTNVADIVWKDDFIESAVDANGFDITRNIVADISEIDTTTPGTYEVIIKVTDFVNNEADVILTVVVE